MFGGAVQSRKSQEDCDDHQSKARNKSSKIAHMRTHFSNEKEKKSPTHNHSKPSKKSKPPAARKLPERQKVVASKNMRIQKILDNTAGNGSPQSGDQLQRTSSTMPRFQQPLRKSSNHKSDSGSAGDKPLDRAETLRFYDYDINKVKSKFIKKRKSREPLKRQKMRGQQLVVVDAAPEILGYAAGHGD